MMETALFYFTCLSIFPVIGSSFFQVNYPNVEISSDPKGNLTIEAGVGGDVLLKPGTGGSVYINNRNLRDIIAKVRSLPPVWDKQSEHASLGTFLAGNAISVSVHATDPEYNSVTYTVVSGRLPPGTALKSSTGQISGVAPDVDATYTFGIRATDRHGKYADGIFSIDIREGDQCSSSPCLNGGSCSDGLGQYTCSCTNGYGDARCGTHCMSHSLGVGVAHKRIPDAQMSGHLTYSTYNAADGRLSSSRGWIGEGSGSWLQVDLGSVKDIFAIAVQGYASSSYYISSFRVQYSVDGNHFVYVLQPGHGSKSMLFDGSSNYNSIVRHELFPTSTTKARFVRFLPVAWHQGGHPGLRVELYGC